MIDPGFVPQGMVQLPCGAKGVQDGYGVRCLDCLTIYGSVSCPCTQEQRNTPDSRSAK